MKSASPWLLGVALCSFAGSAHALEPDKANQAAWMLADFCDHAVRKGPKNLSNADFPSIVIGGDYSLAELNPPLPDTSVKALRLGAGDSVRRLKLVRGDEVVTFWARTDLAACHGVIPDARGARAVFDEHQDRLDSEWSSLKMQDASYAGWQRSSMAGNLIMTLHETPAGTEVLVITEALMTSAGAAKLVDTLGGFANAVVPPCVNAALAGKKPDAAIFASHFEIPPRRPKDDIYYADKPFEGVGLLLFDGRRTCTVLISMDGKSNLAIAKSLAVAFASTPGASVSPVELPSSRESPQQAWQFQDAASGHAVRITLSAIEGRMLVEIGRP